MQKNLSAFWQNFVDRIPADSNVVICPHVFIDADAVSSCLALASLLRKGGYRCRILTDEAPAEHEAFIPEVSRLEVFQDTPEWEDIDLLFLLDCHEAGRLGRRGVLWERASQIAIIDHHQYEQVPPVELCYIDSQASSTAELIYYSYQYWQQAGASIFLDKTSAFQLCCGIYADTGGLQYSNTGRDTFLAMADLMSYDLPLAAISAALFATISREEMRARSLAMLKARFECGGRLVWSFFQTREFLATGVGMDEVGSFSSLLRQVKGVDLAIFMREEARVDAPSILHISLRSSEHFNCLALAQRLGGGGHIRASGAEMLVDQDIYLTVEQVLQVARDELEKQHGEERSDFSR